MKLAQHSTQLTTGSPSAPAFFSKESKSNFSGAGNMFFTKSSAQTKNAKKESDGEVAGVRQKIPLSLQKQDDTITNPAATTPVVSTPATPAPATIASTASEQTAWNERVDNLVRTTFSITGPAARSRISYRDSAAFGAGISATEKEEILVNILFSSSDSLIINILRDNHLLLLRSLSSIRRFVSQAMTTGFIEYTVHAPGVTGPTRVTPDQLVSMFVAGLTTSQRTRSSRRIFMQDLPPNVETLVHEICHFYTSNAFSDLANSATNTDRIEHGLRVQQVLIEGFTEYFARKVMRANSAVLGPIGIQAYEAEYYEAMRIISTMGEAQAANAFFRGDTTQLARLQQSMDQNFQTHPDLLVPEFMID